MIHEDSIKTRKSFSEKLINFSKKADEFDRVFDIVINVYDKVIKTGTKAYLFLKRVKGDYSNFINRKQD